MRFANRFISLSIVVSLVLTIVILTIPFHRSDVEYPPPIETVIIDPDINKDKRQAWINEIHRTAPHDNWRKKDMDFRLKRANNKTSSNNKGSALYGMWRELGSNNMAGRTLVADYDSLYDMIYVSSAGGQIWKGGIGTGDWESLTDHIKIPYIHFLKKINIANYNRLLACSGENNINGFFYSDDEGATWQQPTGLSVVEAWGHIKRAVIKYNPEDGIYLLCQEWDWDNWNPLSTIYASYDLGESFEPLLSLSKGAGLIDIWTDPFSEEDLYLLSQDSMFLVDEVGELSLLGNFSIEEAHKALLAGAKFNDTVNFYALIKNQGTSVFYSSLDGGLNWVNKGFLERRPFMNTSFSASPVTPGLLYFGSIIALTSPDHGVTWDTVNNWTEYYSSPEDKLHADIPSINSFIDENGDEFNLINTDGGIYISYNQLEDVANLSLTNLRISQYYSTYTNRVEPKFTHGGSQDQGYQFTDQVNNETLLDFQQVISGDYGHIVSSDLGATLWMVYPTFAAYIPDATTPNGWTKWNFQGSNFQWMPRLMADPWNPSAVYVGGGRLNEGAHIFHISYANNQMTAVELPYDFSDGIENSRISAISCSPVEDTYRYVMTNTNGFYYSVNGGETWTKTNGFSSPEAHYLYGTTIVPANNTVGLVYIGGSGYSSDPVFVSNDHGETFEPFSTGLPNTLVFNMALNTNDSLLFAATEVGPFVCKTWEGIWYDLTDSIAPDQAYWDVDFLSSHKKVRFATYGRGIWEFDLDPNIEAAFTADKVVINMGDTVNFTDLSSWDPTSWDWVFEGGEPGTSNIQHPQEIIYPEAGIFDVTLSIQKNTSTDTHIKTDFIQVMPISGTKERTTFFSDASIYPNPACDILEVKTLTSIDEITIFSSAGHQVFSVRYHSGQNHQTINLGEIPGGTYLVKIVSGERQISKKLIKR